MNHIFTAVPNNAEFADISNENVENVENKNLPSLGSAIMQVLFFQHSVE